MKRHLSIIFSFCFYSIAIMAQNITGKVVDEENSPIPFVSVILQNTQDSSYINGIATDTDGLFNLPAKADSEYILVFSFIGYETIKMKCTAGDLGIVTMKEDVTMIEEASVVASRTRHDANGYTVNLRSSNIAEGKQTSDAIAFLPGVSHEDGNYRINGLPVSEIYVDGVRLSSAEELKNLPADMIDKIKVNYLAGSDQNAAMTGGTIRITLRQPPQGGYYGSLTAGAVVHPSYGFSNENAGGLIYYRYKNLSVYDNLSLNFNQPEETARQTVWNQDTDLKTEIKEHTRYKGYTINNRLSLTQQINERHSIGGSYFISTNRLNTASLTTASDADATRSAIDGIGSYLDQEATLKYSAILNKRGTAMEITGDYFNRMADSRNTYSYSDNTSDMAEDKSTLNMYKLSVDLTDPYKRNLVWKYGASVQYITSGYTPLQWPSDDSDRFQTSMSATRTSGLTPLIYVSAIGQLWKIRYSIGVNGQMNGIRYEAKDDGSKSSNIQWGINPTVQLMMPLDKEGRHAVMLNYKRTLDDIPYAAISSTIRWSDPYNYTVGNPDLKSPVSDIVMAGVSLFGNLLNLTALYAHMDGNIYWETRQSPNAGDIFYITPVNLPSAHMFGAGIEINWTPVRPWTMKLSGRLEVHPENVTLDGIYYGNTRLRQYYTMYNTFNFRHGWGGMLNIMAEPTYKTYDRTYHTIYNVGGHIYKTFCKGSLQLTLNFNAFGNRRKYDRQADGNTITYQYTMPVQNIGLSLTWRFKGGKQVNVNTLEGAQNYKEIKDVR